MCTVSPVCASSVCRVGNPRHCHTCAGAHVQCVTRVHSVCWVSCPVCDPCMCVYVFCVSGPRAVCVLCAECHVQCVTCVCSVCMCGACSMCCACPTFSVLTRAVCPCAAPSDVVPMCCACSVTDLVGACLVLMQVERWCVRRCSCMCRTAGVRGYRHVLCARLC